MPDRLASLPTFTCIDAGNEVDLWPATPGTPYREANAIGLNRAQELIAVMRRTGSRVLLTHVVETITKRGDFGGMEVGFFQGLSRELIHPEKITEFVTVPPERQFRVGRKFGHLAVVAPQDNGEGTSQSAAAAA